MSWFRFEDGCVECVQRKRAFRREWEDYEAGRPVVQNRAWGLWSLHLLLKHPELYDRIFHRPWFVSVEDYERLKVRRAERLRQELGL